MNIGNVVGIIANQVPIINPDEASKTTQFIRLCNQQWVAILALHYRAQQLTCGVLRNNPIVFLHNVTGFMGEYRRVEHLVRTRSELI